MTSPAENGGAREIEDLRRRLADAEDTLRAIREGEVDALVVRGGDSDEVFTIGGDPDSFRAFMETMDLGAAVADAGGRILYANSTLRRLLGLPHENDSASALTLPPPVSVAIGALMRDAAQSKASAEITLDRAGDAALVLLASASPLHLSTMRGYAVTFTDVSQRARAEAMERSERVAHAIISCANEAVLVCDREGVISHANAAARSVYDGDPVGRRFEDAVPLRFPEATGLLGADDVVSQALAGGSLQGIEATAPKAPLVQDFLISAAPLQVSEGQTSGCVVTMVDLSQRKAAEKQQLLLMGELDHRVKNTLALVLSICSRTIAGSDTLQSFQAAFTGRIQALAATHTLLAAKSWKNLSLRDVVLGEVAPYVGAELTRVNVEGLDAALAPRAAVAFGLVIHELTTNAVKYGALSTAQGEVTIRSHGVSEGALRLSWTESGGPPVAPPGRKGFGRTMVTRALAYSSFGGAEIDFAPAGVVCRIAVPAEDLH